MNITRIYPSLDQHRVLRFIKYPDIGFPVVMIDDHPRHVQGNRTPGHMMEKERKKHDPHGFCFVTKTVRQ